VLSLGTPLGSFFARVHDVAGSDAPRFVATASVCVLDVETGALRYVSAGHPAPVVRCADGTTEVLVDGRSPVVGMPPREVEPGEWQLGVGDTLFVYTDGLVERRGEDLDAGLERLRGYLASLPAGDLDAQASALVERCTAGGRIEDDIALVALRRGPV
jgi:serine phosphatase RsbU (regulator of sigma subunit)